MKIKRNLAISDSGFLFNPATGDSYSVNPLGQDILKMLKDGSTEEEIKEKILEEYSIDAVSVEKDIYDFFNMLKSYKLID